MQLLSSTHTDSNRLLNVLPANSLPEIRALLLEQLGRHKDALRQAAEWHRHDVGANAAWVYASACVFSLQSQACCALQ